ncbi:hypothetical protein WJM97_20235 [Okeanomitos corallinicola TIOX110]|uniref:Uncharacterized protein n=1 Tax=Okeanomitos corallinicola TIOX110 TaxID=3133117 RepID=A0ABZ2UW70_9CYAN
MANTYRIDSDCLELFLIVAEYSNNKTVDAIAGKLKEFANQGKASTSNGIEYTDDKINKMFDDVRKRRLERENNEQFNNRTTKVGAMATLVIGASSLLIIGNVVSLAALAGGVITMAIGAGVATKVKWSVGVPNVIQFKFSSLNEEYGKPFEEIK